MEIIDTFGIGLGCLVDDALNLLTDVKDSKNKPVLQINIDATHSGRLTNDRVYPGIHVRNAAATWTKPAQKPVLKNHSSDADPIGRVTSSKYIQLKTGKAFDEDYLRPSTGVGSGVIQLDIDIMDTDAMEKFLDGRFMEFSTRQQFSSMICSFCGNDYVKNYCGHYPGDVVKVESKKKGGADKEYKVYGITGPLTYREVSVVNIPADSFTRINEMKAAEDALGDSIILSAYDDTNHDISKISLISSAGTDSVDLLRSGNRQTVTSSDRRKLTNKSIFCVAGPDFQQFIEDTDMNKAKLEDPLKEEEKENTTVIEDQTDSDSESSQEGQETEGDQEGVVAPDGEGTDENDETIQDVSDEEVREASMKALTISNKKLERDVKELRSEIERLKGDNTHKDEEIDRLRTSASEFQSKLKQITAKQLLDTKIMLGKPDVSDVSDKETYQEKLSELTKRSLDSLNDALTDISIELSNMKKDKGLIDFTEKPIENPTVNGTPNTEKIINTDSKSENKKVKPTRSQIIDAQLN